MFIMCVSLCLSLVSEIECDDGDFCRTNNTITSIYVEIGSYGSLFNVCACLKMLQGLFVRAPLPASTGLLLTLTLTWQVGESREPPVHVIRSFQASFSAGACLLIYPISVNVKHCYVQGLNNQSGYCALGTFLSQVDLVRLFAPESWCCFAKAGSKEKAEVSLRHVKPAQQ